MKLKALFKYKSSQDTRDAFVISELKNLKKNSHILDAGCGSQRYRNYCNHLIYRSQDFAAYNISIKKMFGQNKQSRYKYGQIDYLGDIWKIDEKDLKFNAILCTEVLEHIPYPNRTIKEFSRLLKPNGFLILTIPSNCLRHMDPYFFYTGFSDRWISKILSENKLEVKKCIQVGDYYSWMSKELYRTIRSHSYLALFFLLPALIWFFIKKENQISRNSLCEGYHILAKKIK